MKTPPIVPPLRKQAKRRFGALTALTLVYLVLAGHLAAQDVTIRQINLGQQKAGTQETASAKVGERFGIEILSMIPGKTYTVDAEIREQTLDPLSPPSVQTQGATSQPAICVDPDKEILAAFQDVNDESKVGQMGQELRAKAVQGQCTDDFDPQWAAHTRRRLNDVFTLPAGTELVVTVRRSDGNTWTRIYRTARRGAWRALYGFTFLPDEDEEYFTRASETEEGKFDIVLKNDDQELGFAPSLFYHWQSQGQASRRGLSWGPAVGLGFDLENPVLFGGVGATWNENVMFTFGAVVHQQKRLDGQFSLDSPVGENLTPDKLTVDTYDVNVYFGVAFRFGSNPFKRTASATPSTPGGGTGGQETGSGNGS